MKVSRNTFWIHSAFGKKLYINYGSVLRAARLKKVLFYFNSDEYLCTYEVAGLGLVEEKLTDNGTRISCKNVDVYESIDAFKEGLRFGRCKNGGMCNNFPGLKLYAEEILTKAFASVANVWYDEKSYCYIVERYRWNGIKAEAVDIHGNVWMDEEGFHTDAKIPAGTFLTKEECEKANQISVIEFEDEE